MRMIWLVMILMFISSACEEEIETPGSESVQPVIVVSGVFTDETKVQSIRLTRSATVNSDDDPLPVSNAVVSISDGQRVISLLETVAGSGLYETTSEVAGEVGRTYTLTLQSNGDTFTASDTMMPVGSIEPVTYVPADKNFFQWDVPKNHTLEPGTTYQWTVDFHHPGEQVTTIVYYNFTGLETSALFALNQMSQSVRFNAGTTIVQRKFSLSPEFYDYLKAVYSETVWKGDLYDVMPANPPTNLSNGAQGYFRVSSVVKAEQTVD